MHLKFIHYQNMKTIKAKEGKVFRRIVDNVLFGNEVHLGYLYHLHGEVLKVPVKELPEHYEEIDEPQDESTTLMDDNHPMEVVEEAGEEKIERTVTVGDYLELENKFNKLSQLIESWGHSLDNNNQN